MRPWHAAAAAAAFTAGGFGIAQAATSIPPNTIHGCVTGSTRILEHVYTSPTSGTTCPSGFQVIWPNGPDDETTAITAGGAGLDTIVATAQSTGNQTAGGMASVTCPTSNPYAIAGGGTIQDGPIKQSEPFGPGPGPGSHPWLVRRGLVSRGGTVV